MQLEAEQGTILSALPGAAMLPLQTQAKEHKHHNPTQPSETQKGAADFPSRNLSLKS